MLPRQKQHLLPSVQHQLQSYALVAVAASSLGTLTRAAEAQIISQQTDIELMQGRAFFDLDGDGVVDVTLQDKHYSTYTGFWHSNTSQRLKVTGPPGGGVIGSGKYAGAMSAGLVVGSTRPFKDFGDKAISMATTGLAHCGSSCYVNIVDGPWISANKRFLGLRFSFGGETHYGWLRLNTRSSIFPPRLDATISGYAYEATPNKSIMAGQLKEGSPADVGSADVTPGALGDLAKGRSPE